VSKFETLWCCRHQAGGKQYATGILHLFFRISPLQKEKSVNSKYLQSSLSECRDSKHYGVAAVKPAAIDCPPDSRI